MYDRYSNEIKTTISNYFQGIYNGDTEKLERVFHPQALLYGDIKGVSYCKNVAAYIDGIKKRKSPKGLGEDFNMKINSIEIIGSNAIVKAHLPMLGFNYYDFLSLNKINGDWKIVNKLFTHVE